MTNYELGRNPESATQGSLLVIDDFSFFASLYCARLGIEPPIEAIHQAGDSLKGLLRQLWGSNVKVEPFESIQERIPEILNHLGGDNRGSLSINLDPAIGVSGDVAELSIHRLSDRAGRLMGYGSRQGAPSIVEQLIQIKEIAKKLSIGRAKVIDDASITTGTVSKVQHLLEIAGLSVEAIVLGVASRQAIDRLKADGLEATAVVITDADFLLSTRDMLPVGGVRSGGVIHPNLSNNHSGVILRPPYSAAPPVVDLRSLNRTNKWTGIPISQVIEISQECWKIGLGFHSVISGVRDVQIGELDSAQSGYPGIPLPYQEIDPRATVAEVVNNGLSHITGVSNRGTVYSFPYRRRDPELEK